MEQKHPYPDLKKEQERLASIFTKEKLYVTACQEDYNTEQPQFFTWLTREQFETIVRKKKLASDSEPNFHLHNEREWIHVRLTRKNEKEMTLCYEQLQGKNNEVTIRMYGEWAEIFRLIWVVHGPHLKVLPLDIPFFCSTTDSDSESESS